jgi:hypothetical protein
MSAQTIFKITQETSAIDIPVILTIPQANFIATDMLPLPSGITPPVYA